MLRIPCPYAVFVKEFLTPVVPLAIFSLEDIQMILTLEFDAREWVFLSHLFWAKIASVIELLNE